MYVLSCPDFNLDFTLDCGQVFRWEKSGDWWTGNVQESLIKIKQNNDFSITIDSDLPETFFHEYFRFDDNLNAILEDINKDNCIANSIKQYYGLRLIRQDPWECLISYMLATASSIPTIKKRILNLCRIFGTEIEAGIFTFPYPEAIANACESELCECKLGFRTKRIKQAAELVVNKQIDPYNLHKHEYHEAREKLMTIEGIGEKVADCILLFSMDKLESFPVDTHIKQIVQQCYSNDEFIKKKSNYNKIAEWGRNYFGNYCGYAQEYLYMYNRFKDSYSIANETQDF